MPLHVLLDMVGSSLGDRVAVSKEDRELTYAELAHAASAGAALAQEAGAGSVAFIGVNGPAFPIALFAASTAGLALTPLNYRLGASQLHAAIDQLERPLVIADERYLPTLGQFAGHAISSERWITETMVGRAETTVDSDDEQPALVLFTSGTTSQAKGVVLTHANLLSYVLQTVDFASAAGEVALVSVPPYHIAGVGTVLTNVFSARRIVYLSDFTPQAWLDAVDKHLVTHAMLVPTMLARIVEELESKPRRLSSLRAIAYGGARTPRVVLERALVLLSGVDFTNAYGLTETSSTIAALGPAEHREALASADPDARERLGSAGRLVPGIEVQVRDELGREVPEGQAGELWVRGAQVSAQYLDMGSLLDRSGWFHTRDRARIDLDGYLFIEGRTDDTIIRGGENIAPAEIEDVLAEHPQVREVAVVGLPDEEWGERTVAVIVAHDRAGLAYDQLRAWARQRLRSSKTPDDFVTWAEGLPYSATGKLLRREIKAQLMARKE